METMEPCLQWPKGLCRRHTTCKYYHAPLEIPPLRPGQCSYLKNGAKRCESTATYTENGQAFCFDHTEAGREGSSSAGSKRQLVPERATKRVSGKSRMVNPFEVAFNIGGQKKETIDTIKDGDFVDPSRPLVVDVGCAQGRFLLQLAHQYQAQQRLYNYVGFELRTSLVDAANEAVHAGEMKGSVRFLQGDAKSTIHAALAPVLVPVTACTEYGASETAAVAYVEWLTIQFPDPWTKKKHYKRRLVDQQFVADCARLISDPRGKVYLCSDRYDLACFMYDTFAASSQWAVVPELTDAHPSTSAEIAPASALDSADPVNAAVREGTDEDAAGEEGDEGGADVWGKEVYREKDADDTRCWLAKRPFPVGTERDSVAEKKNRPVHRAVFRRVVE